MTRRLNFVLLALLLILGAPAYWLLIDSSPHNVAAKPLSLTQLRQLAAAIPGHKPTRVDMEMVAWKLLPGNVFAAGSGLKRRLIGVLAFRLELPDHGPVLIETGTSAAIAKNLGMDQFDPKAQRHVDLMLRQASLILVTHEHGDHLGGLAALSGTKDGLAAASRIKLNQFQLPTAPLSDKLPWPQGLLLSAKIGSLRPQAVAPGIVVIPASGHTPGSQMIFVSLVDGSEYLFTGDISPMATSWQELRPRSRLLTDFVAPENRREILSWLQAIAALKQQVPSLHVIPSHDYEWLRDPKNHSGVKRLPGNIPNNLAGN